VFLFSIFFPCFELGKFILLQIFCSTFSLAFFLVFSLHLSKAHSLIISICYEWCVFVITFKKHRNLFSDRSLKGTLTTSRSPPFLLLWNIQWHDCWGFYFQWFVRIEPKFDSAIIFHPSSCELTFTLYTFIISFKKSFKAKNIKAASIRKDHITVKVKMLYVKVKVL
jgi:hypothetical protein